MRESNGSACAGDRRKRSRAMLALFAWFVPLILAACGGGDFASDGPANVGPAASEGSSAATAPADSPVAAASAAAPAATSPLVIRRQPTSTDVREGGIATFSVDAEGPRPLGYQWLHDGEPIAGANGPVLQWPATLADHLSRIRVIVRAGGATLQSDSAVLRVGQS